MIYRVTTDFLSARDAVYSARANKCLNHSDTVCKELANAINRSVVTPIGYETYSDHEIADMLAKLEDPNTFSYVSFDHPRRSVIPRAVADQAADLFEARNSNPFSVDYDAPKDEKGRHAAAYLGMPEIVAFVSRLPAGWNLDVSHVLSERLSNRHWADIAAAVGQLSPAMRLELEPRVAKRERGICKPREADLSYLCETAKVARKFKPAYTPEPGCKAVLYLKRAVCVRSSQESYSDDATFFVPVDIEPGADRKICERNLGAFVTAARTHNGFAGSGSTYSASLVENAAGAFVVISQRASIAD